MYSRFKEETKDPITIKEEFEELEFQVFRMQENLKEIAKKHEVIGIEQTKENEWVIISAVDNGETCKVMVNDCASAYQDIWDFTIHAYYKNNHTIHIGDIKGPANKGYGSICMDYLKDIAKDQNIQYITGDLAKRDWDHVERLIYFYEKHDFQVSVDHDQQSGEITWCDGY